MPYREFKERAEQCGVCNAESVQICRRCGIPVCGEHSSKQERKGRTRRRLYIPRGDRAIRGVCLGCAGELEQRIAGLMREHEQPSAPRLEVRAAPPGLLMGGSLEFFQEFLMEHRNWRRLRRLLSCFERERPRHLEQQRDFRRRRVTEGICITCGEPALRCCSRCGTGLCEAHGVDQALGRCARCERDFREAAGMEPDWLNHPLRAIRFFRRRRCFLEQHSWDPAVYNG